jgi:hypothetical protein
MMTLLLEARCNAVRRNGHGNSFQELGKSTQIHIDNSQTTPQYEETRIMEKVNAEKW